MLRVTHGRGLGRRDFLTLGAFGLAGLAVDRLGGSLAAAGDSESLLRAGRSGVPGWPAGLAGRGGMSSERVAHPPRASDMAKASRQARAGVGRLARPVMEPALCRGPARRARA